MSRAFLACGHYSQRVALSPMIQTHAECPWGCGVQPVDDEPLSNGAANVIPDFPAHYSVAFDQVVTSRRHHRELQRINGTHDYEPVKDSPGSYLSKVQVDRARRQRVIFNG